MTADPTARAPSQLPDPRRMEAHIFLADAAQVDSSGKVHALGLGWSTTITPLPAQAVVILIKVPWNQANRAHKLRAELLTQDGQPVTIPGPVGDPPGTIGGDFEAGRPAWLTRRHTARPRLRLQRSTRHAAGTGRYVWDCRSTAHRKTAGLRAFVARENTVTPLWGRCRRRGSMIRGSPSGVRPRAARASPPWGCVPEAARIRPPGCGSFDNRSLRDGARHRPAPTSTAGRRNDIDVRLGPLAVVAWWSLWVPSDQRTRTVTGMYCAGHVRQSDPAVPAVSARSPSR
jgi:hypothetical protein